MHPRSRTVEQVHRWRLRTRKVMVRLLQQSQHAQSAFGAPKVVYTNDAHFLSAVPYDWRGTDARGLLPPCCPDADPQKKCSIKLRDVKRHSQAHVQRLLSPCRSLKSSGPYVPTFR